MGRRKKLGPQKKKEKKKNPFESGACASLDVHSISCCFFFFRTIIFDSFLAWGWLAPTDITARLHVQLLSKSQENPFRNKKKEEEEKKDRLVRLPKRPELKSNQTLDSSRLLVIFLFFSDG